MNKQQEISWFQRTYFAFYFAFAALSVYMIPFLKEIGYDAMQRGIQFSCMALLAIVMQMVVGYICDKFHVMKKTTMLLAVLQIASVYACYLFTKQVFWYHLALISIMGGIYKINYNLLDSWSLLCGDKIANQFGSMRAYGALGFTLGTYITSKLIDLFSFAAIGHTVAATTIIALWCCAKLPVSKKEKGYTTICKEDFAKLLKNKAYVLLILIFLGINIVGTADQFTTVDKMIQLEATKAQVGYKWAIQSASEIPVFLLSWYLLQKFHGYHLMIIGMIMYCIKFWLYGLVSSIGGILLVTALQTISYPLITLSSRILFAQIAKEQAHLKTSAQLIASSIYLGVSALVAPILCGFLVSTIGHDWTLYGLAIFLGLVTMFALFCKRTIAIKD